MYFARLECIVHAVRSLVCLGHVGLKVNYLFRQVEEVGLSSWSRGETRGEQSRIWLVFQLPGVRNGAWRRSSVCGAIPEAELYGE